MAGTAPVRREPERPAPARDEHARALVFWGIAAAYAGACLVYALYLARTALLLVYLSALLAIGLAPFARLLERRAVLRNGTRPPRWTLVAAVYLVVLGAAVALLLLVVPTLAGQAQSLARQTPALLHAGQRWLVAHGLLVRELTVPELVRQAPVDGDALGTVVGTVSGLAGGVLGIVTILVLSFYFLVETDTIFAAFIRAVPRRHRAHVRAVAGEITGKVSAWLSGQLMVSAIIATTTAVGLGLLGVPYFYVLAIVAGIGEAIPYAGPILSALPAVAIAAQESWRLALAVAAFFVVQQQLENNVIVPRLMSNQVGLGSSTVIVAVLIGASIFGLVGAVLAVPTAAIVQVLVHEIVPANDA